MVAISEIRMESSNTGKSNGILKIDIRVNPPVVFAAIPDVTVNKAEKASEDKDKLSIKTPWLTTGFPTKREKKT